METFEINQQLDPAMIITAYLIYLPIALLLTYYVARILFKNGKVFMIDIFRGREEIATATNRLFEMGFYLLNLGFAYSVACRSAFRDTGNDRSLKYENWRIQHLFGRYAILESLLILSR